MRKPSVGRGAFLPLVRVRIGLQATSEVDPAECPFGSISEILSLRRLEVQLSGSRTAII
jgi:hypothetical protein